MRKVNAIFKRKCNQQCVALTLRMPRLRFYTAILYGVYVGQRSHAKRSRLNASAISSTVDLQSVRIFHGSVWFVRAIGFTYFLWHAQTIRFHEIFERSVNPLYSGFQLRSNIPWKRMVCPCHRK